MTISLHLRPILILIAIVGSAGQAAALTICSGTCPSGTPPGSTVVVQQIDPGVLPVIPQLSVAGLLFAPNAPGGVFNVEGDLFIHVEQSLTIPIFEIRAEGAIEIEPLGPGIVLTFDQLILCASDGCDRDPFENPDASFDTDPFHIGFEGDLTGALRVHAGGNVVVTSSPFPIPEPGSAALVGLGLAILATRRSRRGSRGGAVVRSA